MIDSELDGRRFPRLVQRVVWLRRHRRQALGLTFLSIAAAFLVDLIIPGYAIAGFYLIPLLLVAFARREGRVVAVVGILCLSLAVFTMVIQGRTDGQNILLVGFGALAGVGLIALGYLYDRFDQLYETERSTTAKLQSLTAQLQRLQEVSVLGSDRPLSDLLDHIVQQAQQLLGGDGGVLYRHDAGRDLLRPEAAVGVSCDATAAMSPPIGKDPAGTAARERRPVATTDLRVSWNDGDDHLADPPSDWIRDYGACIAVPLMVEADLFGVIALYYREPRPFSEEDVSLAQSFGDQAALAIENARLREQLERSAVAAERLRLARDLHDSVTQSLFAASLKAEALSRKWRPASAEARRTLDDVYHLTRGALAEMRTLLLEMRPAALAQSSLDDLLRHLVVATEARTRIPVKLSLADSPALPADVKITLYRIAQEAMNNVVRHSQARSAWVTLGCADGLVKLVVGDDGRGFDASRVGPEEFGLQIMRERAEAVAATLSVASESRRGTVVTTEWSDSQG
ncbi:MAG: GAF domain-containing protein [Thermoleophilia bacterium]